MSAAVIFQGNSRSFAQRGTNRRREGDNTLFSLRLRVALSRERGVGGIRGKATATEGVGTGKWSINRTREAISKDGGR